MAETSTSPCPPLAMKSYSLTESVKHRLSRIISVDDDSTPDEINSEPAKSEYNYINYYSTLLNKRACTFSFSKGLWSALYALLDPTRLLKFTNFILLVNKNAIKCEFSCTFIRICPWTFIFFQKGLTLDSY